MIFFEGCYWGCMTFSLIVWVCFYVVCSAVQTLTPVSQLKEQGSDLRLLGLTVHVCVYSVYICTNTHTYIYWQLFIFLLLSVPSTFFILCPTIDNAEIVKGREMNLFCPVAVEITALSSSPEGPEHDAVITKAPDFALWSRSRFNRLHIWSVFSELCNKCSCLHSLLIHMCDIRELLAFFKQNVRITCKSKK